MDLLLATVAVSAVVTLVLVLVRRPAGPDPAVLESLARSLGGLQAELARLARGHEDLRSDVQRGRETQLLQLSETTQALRGDIGQAHRALAEVRALEEGRVRQVEQAALSLRRVEAVLAGSSTRGVAGENILARALGQLPPDLLELNVAFGARVVEYALRLPGGLWLPIDSKWTSAASLERLEEAPVAERKRLLDQVARDLRARIREVTKYLDPQRTAGLALLAVPEAVHKAVPECHAEGWREGVLVVPYDLVLPFVLALYRLFLRQGGGADTTPILEGLRGLEEMLRRASEEVEGRLSRALVQAENGRDALRDALTEASRTADRLLRAAAGPEGVQSGTADAANDRSCPMTR